MTYLGYLACVLFWSCLLDVNRDGQFKLGVAGDSNNLFQGWPIKAAALLPRAQVVNGHRLVDEPAIWEDAAQSGTACRDGGAGQVPKLLRAGADVIFLAFGTNDLRGGQGQTPYEVLACYQGLVAQAAQDGVEVIVATTPPVYGDGPAIAANNLLVDQLNMLVRAAFPHVVEFHDGFTQEYFLPDGVHVNDAGNDLRARRAIEALGQR
jgi:lysophospholipase L1-like esterase